MQQRPSAVYLLSQHQAHHYMRQYTTRKCDFVWRALFDLRRESIGAADDEAWTDAILHPITHPARQHRCSEGFASFITHDWRGTFRHGGANSLRLKREHPVSCLAGAVFRLQLNDLDAGLRRHSFGVFLDTSVYPRWRLVSKRKNINLHDGPLKTKHRFANIKRKTLNRTAFPQRKWLEARAATRPENHTLFFFAALTSGVLAVGTLVATFFTAVAFAATDAGFFAATFLAEGLATGTFAATKDFAG